MSFPVVEDRSVGSNNSINPFILPLPTPVAEGDLLIAFHDHDSSGTTTWPSPWVEIGSAVQAPGGGDRQANVSVAYLKATGGETTVSINIQFTSRAAGVVYRITDHIDPDIQAPEITIIARGIVNVLDLPSLTPTGGAKDYLWIGGGGRGVIHVATAAPPNYTDLTTVATSLDGASVHTCERNLNATSEDPGNITGVWNTDTTVAILVAVHPAPPPLPPMGNPLPGFWLG